MGSIVPRFTAFAPLRLRWRIGYANEVRIVGRHILVRAALADGGVAWRMGALLGEVAGARWRDVSEFLDRYPSARDQGRGTFRLAMDEANDVIMSICFATGIVAFRSVVRSRRSAAI